MARAVPKRRREFSAGRALAHALLDELGAPDTALLPGARRQPLWPTGFVGSISHADEACAVVVARSEALSLVGVDLEEDGPLPERVGEHVLRPEEVAGLVAVPGGAARAGRLAFSAKECVYKALAPRLDRVLEFQEVGLRWGRGATEQGGGFEARFVGPRGVPPGCPDRIAGRWIRSEGLLLTVVAVAPQAPIHNPTQG